MINNKNLQNEKKITTNKEEIHFPILLLPPLKSKSHGRDRLEIMFSIFSSVMSWGRSEHQGHSLHISKPQELCALKTIRLYLFFGSSYEI